MTSKTKHQYYYTEVLEEEEGELMLHNKRQYGILLGKIIEKDEINSEDVLNDISIYPSRDKDDVLLEYNQNTLQLKFNYDNTSKCKKGCYLLVTYEQIIPETKEELEEFNQVGYEFTILSRFWNTTDYISKVIDIPYNEYIIGYFSQGASREHFYSFFIPDESEAEKIIIQLEGYYIEAFYMGGRRQINTMNDLAKQLEIKDGKNITILEVKSLKLNQRIMSFAVRPLVYNSKIISSYYFRVLYTKKNETKYLPMDSNLGNLCIPEKHDSNDDFYYCNLKLKNDYNELSKKFAVSSTNQNEYFKINISGRYKNGTIFEDTKDFYYVYDKIIKDIDYFKFKFIFENIAGEPGNNTNYTSSPDAKGKLTLFPISNEDNITFSSVSEKYIFYLQLINNMKNEEIKEINHGKPLVQWIGKPIYPIYYYYKIKNNESININVKLNDYNEYQKNDYKVNGYILNESLINRKINEEYIEFPEKFAENKSIAFGLSFLQINLDNITDYDNPYVLIKISDEKKNNSHTINSYFELTLKENEENKPFLLPKNKYMIETIDGKNNITRNINQYYIPKPDGNISKVVIELSTKSDDIIINFNDDIENHKSIISGFIKFRITKCNSDIIKFNVTNNSERKTNYMIRYYLSDIINEKSFIFDKEYTKSISYSSSTNENANISLTFNNIKLKENIFIDNEIQFYINGTLYEKNNYSNESINSICILNDKVPAYKSKTFAHYKNSSWTLRFNGIERRADKTNNFIYELRLLVNVIFNSTHEEFLVFETEVDLTEIKIEEESEYLFLAYVIPISIIIAIVIIFFIIKFLRLKKKNANLKQEVISFLFSNDVQKNVLSKEFQLSKKESDYESTFI